MAWHQLSVLRSLVCMHVCLTSLLSNVTFSCLHVFMPHLSCEL